MYGKVESKKAGIGFGRSVVEFGAKPDVVIASILTVRSRISSGPKGQVKSLGTNFELLYPPKVRLPRTLLNPM
jgi:hypothetical protein